MHWVSAEPECGLISTPEYGTHGLTCYYPGTTNLIISVPHGGEMRPPFIANRQRPSSGKLSEGNKLTKLTRENTLTKEESKSTEEDSKSTKEGNKSTKEDSKSTKEGIKLAKKVVRLTKEGSSDLDEDMAGSKSTKESTREETKEGSKSTSEEIKSERKGMRLRKEGNSDPDEDTAGRITTAADIYTQVYKYIYTQVYKGNSHQS